MKKKGILFNLNKKSKMNILKFRAVLKTVLFKTFFGAVHFAIN